MTDSSLGQTETMSALKRVDCTFLNSISKAFHVFWFQLTITSSQMQWTSDCTKALASTKERGDKKALKSLKKKQVRDAAYGKLFV